MYDIAIMGPGINAKTKSYQVLKPSPQASAYSEDPSLPPYNQSYTCEAQRICDWSNSIPYTYTENLTA